MQSELRWRRLIGGILSLAVGCFVLLITVFVSVLFSNQTKAMTVKDAVVLLTLYGIGGAFLIGGMGSRDGHPGLAK